MNLIDFDRFILMILTMQWTPQEIVHVFEAYFSIQRLIVAAKKIPTAFSKATDTISKVIFRAVTNSVSQAISGKKLHC